MNSLRLRFFVISQSVLFPLLNASYAADVDAGRMTATQCAICHGSDGEGNGAPKSRISGMDVEVFIKHIHDFQTGTRKNVMMERFVKNLSDEDIENLAAFYAAK